jgi:hypothetical protein
MSNPIQSPSETFPKCMYCCYFLHCILPTLSQLICKCS